MQGSAVSERCADALRQRCGTFPRTCCEAFAVQLQAPCRAQLAFGFRWRKRHENPSLSDAGCSALQEAACLTFCSDTTLVCWQLLAAPGAALPHGLHPAPAQHSKSVSLASASGATLHQLRSSPASHAKHCSGAPAHLHGPAGPYRSLQSRLGRLLVCARALSGAARLRSGLRVPRPQGRLAPGHTL